jgi:hypothetical protein
MATCEYPSNSEIACDGEALQNVVAGAANV